MFGQQVCVLAHALAGALDLDDNSMVQKAVEQRGGDDRIAKDVTPFREAAVGGEDHGTLFITGVDELEEEITAAGGDGQIADFVYNEQRCTTQEADFLAQRSLAFGLGKRSDQVRQRDKVDALARFDGLDCEGCRYVTFACPRRPQQRHNFCAIDKVEARQCHDPVAVQRWLEREVLSGKRLDDREPCHAQRGLHPVVFP